jgi:hypothetical protein
MMLGGMGAVLGGARTASGRCAGDYGPGAVGLRGRPVLYFCRPYRWRGSAVGELLPQKPNLFIRTQRHMLSRELRARSTRIAHPVQEGWPCCTP